MLLQSQWLEREVSEWLNFIGVDVALWVLLRLGYLRVNVDFNPEDVKRSRGKTQ